MLSNNDTWLCHYSNGTQHCLLILASQFLCQLVVIDDLCLRTLNKYDDPLICDRWFIFENTEYSWRLPHPWQIIYVWEYWIQMKTPSLVTDDLCLRTLNTDEDPLFGDRWFMFENTEYRLRPHHMWHDLCLRTLNTDEDPLHVTWFMFENTEYIWRPPHMWQMIYDWEYWMTPSPVTDEDPLIGDRWFMFENTEYRWRPPHLWQMIYDWEYWMTPSPVTDDLCLRTLSTEWSSCFSITSRKREYDRLSFLLRRQINSRILPLLVSSFCQIESRRYLN